MAECSNIRTLGPHESLTFFNSQSVILPYAIKPLTAWNIIMSKPQPILKLAFRIRDAISAKFGVKKIGGFAGDRVASVRVGDHLDFFLVEEVDDQCLVLTERDKHLDVMTCVSTEGTKLTITSSVITHNWFGRAYMLPVGPAHKLIVRGMLARLERDVAAQFKGKSL